MQWVHLIASNIHTDDQSFFGDVDMKLIIPILWGSASVIIYTRDSASENVAQRTGKVWTCNFNQRIRMLNWTSGTMWSYLHISLVCRPTTKAEGEGDIRHELLPVGRLLLRVSFILKSFCRSNEKTLQFGFQWDPQQSSHLLGPFQLHPRWTLSHWLQSPDYTPPVGVLVLHQWRWQLLSMSFYKLICESYRTER